MSLRPITNRQTDGRFALPADGWFQLAPVGEFPHPESGLLQVLDEAALVAMTNRLVAEGARLVDFDHFSYDTSKSSEAAGWIEDLQVRDDGLWARPRWSDLGESALVNGRYRYVSPVWLPGDCESLGGNRVRPLRLDSAGLTNQPNLRGMAPLTNRTGGDPAPTPSDPQTLKTMKTVANRLGLSADASEESILAEVNKLIVGRDQAVAELAPLKNRVQQLEQTERTTAEARATEDLETYKDLIPADHREAWKVQLLANRAGTLAVLKQMQDKADALARAAGTPVLRNRGQGGSGGTPDGQGDAQARARQAEEKIESFRLANRCTYTQARDYVRARHPELFGPAPAAAK